MHQINLLPWREEARKVKKFRFGLTVSGWVLLTLFFVLLLHVHYVNKIDQENQRIAYIQSIFDKQNASLMELNKKNKEQASIIEELQFLISLREKSYQTIRSLDELARIVPDGITLNEMTLNKNTLILLGRAQSDLQITFFMKNISKSNAFQQPVLSEISSKESSAGKEVVFQLIAELKDRQ